MLNIILPNFYLFNTINEKFKFLIKEKPEYFYQSLVKIDSEEGNFPYSFWSGNRNINVVNNFVTYQEIQSFLYKDVKIGLDFTNNNLSLDDIKNNREIETTLQILSNGSNYLILNNNKDINNYLKETFPYFYQCYMFNDIDLVDKNLFRVKVNYNELNSITNIPKSKIDVVLSTKCNSVKCKKYEECKNKEQLSQYLFSENSYCDDCNECEIKYNFSNEIQYLKDNHYSFVSFNMLGFPLTEKNYIKLLCETFIKEEYLYKAIYFLFSGDFEL